MNYQLIFPEFQPAFDGIYATAKIMELLAAEREKLSSLVAMLPAWHVAGRSVPCPWDRKGAVMRSLHDEAAHGGNGKVETLDGIRLPREGGWVLSDLGSHNGTRLNGWLIREPVVVRPGDRVEFGAMAFILTGEPGRDDPPGEPGRDDPPGEPSSG